MIKPGETAPLNVTQEAKHRIYVGLGWDPHENPSLGETIGALVGAKDKHHDLDLSCFYYDQQHNPLGIVTAQENYYADSSGTIYHSGDNVEGIGEGDDEQISVELKDLSREVFHLVFKASIKSGHVFDDIESAEIRLCDGYTDRCFLETGLSAADDAFVFVRLYRDGHGWGLHHIGAFLKNAPLDDLKEVLKTYLD